MFYYLMFILSQAFSELGDAVVNVGVFNVAYDAALNTPGTSLALFHIAKAIPIFLFSNVLTVGIGTRWLKMAIGADLARLVLALLLAAGCGFLAENKVTMWLMLFLFIFSLEIFTIVFNNCKNSIVPKLYPKDGHVEKAHLYSTTLGLMVSALGPAALINIINPGAAVTQAWFSKVALFDALTFGLSALALLFLRKKLSHLSLTESEIEKPSGNFFQRFKKGWETLNSYPKVKNVLMLSFFYNLLLMGPTELGCILFYRSDLQLSPAQLSWNEFLFVVGCFFGTLVVMAKKYIGKNHLKDFSLAILLDGLSWFPVPLAVLAVPSLGVEKSFLTVVAPLLLFHYAFVPFVRVVRLSAVQRLAPEKDWSTLLGFHTLAVEGASAASVVLVAFVAHGLSGAALLRLAGCGAVLAGCAGLWLSRPQIPDAKRI